MNQLQRFMGLMGQRVKALLDFHDFKKGDMDLGFFTR